MFCTRLQRPINVSFIHVSPELGFNAACADRKQILEKMDFFDWIIHSEDDSDIRLSNFLAFIHEYEYLQAHGPPRSMPILLRTEVSREGCLLLSDMGCGEVEHPCTATTSAANTFRWVRDKLYLVDYNSYMAAFILRPKDIWDLCHSGRWSMEQYEALGLLNLIDTREYCSSYALYESIPCTQYNNVGACLERQGWEDWSPQPGRFVAYNYVGAFESLAMLHLSNKLQGNTCHPDSYRISFKTFLEYRGIKYNRTSRSHYLDSTANKTAVFFLPPHH